MTGRKKRLAIFLCLAMLLSVCTPLVSSAAVVPTVGAAVSANNSVKVVSTQAQLNSALTMSGVKQIVIRTDKAAAFEIPKGNYSAKKLVIRAPKAEIKNAGTFRSVTIYSVSDQAYTENADHNKIRVLASGGKIVVSAGRTVDSLSVVRKNCRVKIVVNGTVQQIDVKKASNLAMEVTGSIKKMNVNATSTITVAGDSKDTTIIVNKAARNSRITVSAPATVKLKAATTVTLKKGAENAKLVIPKSSAKAVSYTLVNETDSTLKLNTSSGTKTLANGKSYDGKESGGSNTVITGGGSGGTSGGSSGGSGGGNGGGTTEPPVIEKKELPVAAEITGVDSFCVYVDAVDDPGVLDVKVTSDGNEIALRASTAAAIEIDQPKVFYAKDGKPEHVYGYCCTFAAIENFESGIVYTVSLAETGTNYFKEQTMITSNVREEALKLYEDNFRDAFEGQCFSVREGMNENELVEMIDYGVESSDVNSPLRDVYELFERDNLKKNYSIAKAAINEEVCPVTVQLTKGKLSCTFTCNMVFFIDDTAKGSLLYVKRLLQKEGDLFFDKSGSCELKNSAGLKAVISEWQSSNPSLVEINGYTAKVTLPQVGAEDVILRAKLSQDGESIWIEKTATVDSGYRMPEYVGGIDKQDTGVLEAAFTRRADNSDGKNDVKDTTDFQWCRMPVGSNAAVEDIPGAIEKSYTPGSAGETGTYWYCCKLTSSFGGETNVFYSNFVKVTIE